VPDAWSASYGQAVGRHRGGDDDGCGCLPVGEEAVQDRFQVVDRTGGILIRKQSSPLMRWHSVTSGVAAASPAILGSCPAVGPMRTPIPIHAVGPYPPLGWSHQELFAAAAPQSQRLAAAKSLECTTVIYLRTGPDKCRAHSLEGGP